MWTAALSLLVILLLGDTLGQRPKILSRPTSRKKDRNAESADERRRLSPAFTLGDCPDATVDCQSAPLFVPKSGTSFNHAGAAELVVPRPGLRVYYTTDGSDPRESSSRSFLGGGLVHLAIDPPCPKSEFGKSSNATSYCTFRAQQRQILVRAFTLGKRDDRLDNSFEVNATYNIWTGRHGRAILVPHFHGLANVKDTSFTDHSSDGWSGRMVQVLLNTLPLRTVHLHDVITDFAEYPMFTDTAKQTLSYAQIPTPADQGRFHPQSLSPDSDWVGRQTSDSVMSDNQCADAAFTNPGIVTEYYVTARETTRINASSAWSHALGSHPLTIPPMLPLTSATMPGTMPYRHQLQIWDLAGSDHEALRGFWGGFEAASRVEANRTYGFFVPYFNGANYSGNVVRVDLQAFHNANTTEAREDAITTLDLTRAHPRAR